MLIHSRICVQEKKRESGKEAKWWAARCMPLLRCSSEKSRLIYRHNLWEIFPLQASESLCVMRAMLATVQCCRIVTLGATTWMLDRMRLHICAVIVGTVLSGLKDLSNIMTASSNSLYHLPPALSKRDAVTRRHQQMSASSLSNLDVSASTLSKQEVSASPNAT